MLTRLAHLGTRHPRRVAFAALAFFLLAAAFGGPAASKLKARNGFDDPSSQSAEARSVIERATGAEATPGVLALVAAPPNSSQVASAARTIARVRGVAAVSAPPTTATPGRPSRASSFVSRNGLQTLIAVTLRSAPDPNDVVDRLKKALAGRHDVQLGGGDVSAAQVSTQASHDLGLGELLAFPLLAILALFIFRGVAALLPLAIGATSVVGTFLALRVINAALPLSSFALNLVIGLGLGLAVDYSLFLLSRFREELAHGDGRAEAIRRTLLAAGRTILYSSLTVAAAMTSLLVFPQRFLVSMGIGGAVVALIAAASALLILPALFALFGERLGRVGRSSDGLGRWYRLSRAVMRRPGFVAIATAAVLLLVAWPALGVRWSGVDATVLPTSQSARVVSDVIARDFPAREQDTVVIAARAPASASAALQGYAGRLAAVDGVAGVDAPRYVGSGVWSLSLGASGDPISSRAQQVVKAIRGTPAPFVVAVGGGAAEFLDQRAAIAAHLPVALIVLAAVTLLILWLMTGSVVLPFKTLVMNALTTAAATGLLVFVFQHGRLTGLLSYTSQGGVEQTDFLVLAALAFALSTDYGVILLTRIKEEHDAGAENREAVAIGLGRTGSIVTAAAILLAVALGAFSISKVVFLKEIGLGGAAAVLIDAFIVRALLVPSLMALLGDANWWSPAPLRRLHARLGHGSWRAVRGYPSPTA